MEHSHTKQKHTSSSDPQSLTFYLSYILTYYDILSGILSDIYSDSLSAIRCDILSDIYIHILFWQSIWHSIFHSIWHFVWQIFWHSIFAYVWVRVHACSTASGACIWCPQCPRAGSRRRRRRRKGRKDGRKEGVAPLLKSRELHLVGWKNTLNMCFVAERMRKVSICDQFGSHSWLTTNTHLAMLPNMGRGQNRRHLERRMNCSFFPGSVPETLTWPLNYWIPSHTICC